MNVCRKCYNVNVDWNGTWMQCANCGEVHEKKNIMQVDIASQADSFEVKNNLQDIVLLPLQLTLLGKLTSRFHLMA